MTSHKFLISSRWSSVAAVLLTFLTSTILVQAQTLENGDATAPVTFTQQKTPNPLITNFAYGISGDSESDIWTVGAFSQAMHFDGSTWHAVSMALPFMADMRAVSLVSPSDVWAVGSVFDSTTQHYTSTIQHFDGKKWSVVPSPHFATGDQLFGVKAIASGDVFAAGESHSDNQKPLPLIEHFDGIRWSVVPTPPIKKGQTLTLGPIAAISPTDVWVTGHTFPPRAAILHFDGQKFQNVFFPLHQAALGGLAALATNDVWVVGGQSKNNALATLTAHWDGKDWTVVSSPNLTQENELRAISAISSTDIWAVGCTACGADIGVNQTGVIEHWDGKQWTINPSPLIGRGVSPFGVLAFSSGGVYVSGTSVSQFQKFQNLILHATEGN